MLDLSCGSGNGGAHCPEHSYWRTLYEGWYEKIEEACQSLGHTLGFNPPIVSSVRAFESRPRLLLMGTNPGGSRDYPEHRGKFRFEDSDGYLGTSWRGHLPGEDRLQKQVAHLVQEMRRRTGDTSPIKEFALRRVVSCSLVPFRSPSESALHRRSETLAFARSFWSQVFAVWRPDYAVCFGSTPYKELLDMLGASVEHREYDPKWQGALKIDVFEEGTRLLGLPHISRFPIFGRSQSAPAIKAAFDDLFSSYCRL